MFLSGRVDSPALAILSRWARWFFISVAGGGLVYLAEWTPYGLGTLLSLSFLFWFVIETAYNWLAVQALSQSDIPLFPAFEINRDGDQWPSENRFIRLRDYIRKEGFKKIQSLISKVGGQALMRMICYENDEKTIRLNILMLPNQKGSHSLCFSFMSESASGVRLITDNIFLPFGGFYPEDWEVERRPLYRSVERLLNRHIARMDALAEEFVESDSTPLEQINMDQGQLERLNRDLGFLNKRAFEAETGKLTPAGRARIWQEIWTLSYLGRSLRYQ